MQLNLSITPHTHRVDDYLATELCAMLRRNGLYIESDKIHLVRADPAFDIKKLAKITVDLLIAGGRCPENEWVSLQIGLLD